MSLPTQPSEGPFYRLVLVSPESCSVLAQRNGAGISLPRVGIPMWRRPAKEIQKTIRNNWGMAAIVLDFLEKSRDPAPCVVAQLLDLQPRGGLTYVPLDELPASDLNESERNTIEAICAGDSGGRGVFSRLGWVDEALQWICEASGRKVQFTGEIEQHNASGAFALLRFATGEGPAYWLKATGEANRHEFAITATLAATWPECLPPVIGMRHDWNAWLMEEAGAPLGQRVSVLTLKRVAVSMADLQKRTSHHIGKLIAAGATDQRIAVLREYVGEVVDYLEEAMELQTSTKVSPLGVARLREIGTILKDSCDAMRRLNIPATVIHNDLSRGNILCDENHCVFTDWCEACVGNPFITLQHLLLLLPRSEKDWDVDCFDVMRAYKQRWLDSLTPWQIDQAFALMPLLAIVSHLYGRGDWLRSARRHEPHIQSYARSLARQMDRAATNPSLLEALCH